MGIDVVELSARAEIMDVLTRYTRRSSREMPRRPRRTAWRGTDISQPARRRRRLNQDFTNWPQIGFPVFMGTNSFPTSFT